MRLVVIFLMLALLPMSLLARDIFPPLGSGNIPSPLSEQGLRAAGLKGGDFSPAEKRSAEQQVKHFIHRASACRSHDDCVAIVANCFGCFQAINKQSVKPVYESLAIFHSRYGQCEKACALMQPETSCRSGRCVISQ